MNETWESAWILFLFLRKICLSDDLRTNAHINPLGFAKVGDNEQIDTLTRDSQSIAGFCKRSVSRMCASPKARYPLRSASSESSENLMVSFAMSPIFFSIIQMPPIQLSSQGPSAWLSWVSARLRERAGEPVLSLWDMVQSTAKVLLVSFDISDNSCGLFCNVQCSVKMGFSYSLLFFTDKMLPGLLQFCEMKQQ